MARIEELAALEGAEINGAKVVLADEATKLLHGEACLAEIHATVANLFAGSAGSSSTAGAWLLLSVIDRGCCAVGRGSSRAGAVSINPTPLMIRPSPIHSQPTKPPNHRPTPSTHPALPRVSVTAAELGEAGLMAADLFVRLDMAKSKAEARRLIKGGGARLDGEPIKEETFVVTSAAFGGKAEIMLSAGKKKHGMVELVK